MKPTSIVSLIVAFILVVAGLVTCFVAQNIASANGEFIFAESRDGNLVNTVEISEEISKIELIVSDAQINVYGDSDKSYVEFVNFNENYYSLAVSNTILSFDEIPDLMSLVKFWENGFSFKGMRYILNFSSRPSDEVVKSVNIYLTSAHKLKIIDITAENCSLDISNVLIDCDYKLCANNITVNASSLKTAGTFNINSSAKEEPAENVELNITYSNIKNLNITSKNLVTNVDIFKLSGDSSITCENGDISFKFASDPEILNLDIKTEGILTVSDEVYLGTYVHAGNPDSPHSMKISAKNADVEITKTTNTTPPQANAE